MIQCTEVKGILKCSAELLPHTRKQASTPLPTFFSTDSSPKRCSSCLRVAALCSAVRLAARRAARAVASCCCRSSTCRRRSPAQPRAQVAGSRYARPGLRCLRALHCMTRARCSCCQHFGNPCSRLTWSTPSAALLGGHRSCTGQYAAAGSPAAPCTPMQIKGTHYRCWQSA